MSVLSIQTRRIDGLTEATTAEDEDLLLIRKADGTGTRNIKKKNLIPKTVDKVGDLNELTTVDKKSVVNAVNETHTDIRNLIRHGDTIEEKLKEIRGEYKFVSGQGLSGNHNALYRGKSLGFGISEDQIKEIRNGTFSDMYIGDYFFGVNTEYYIAHFDYFPTTTHHVVLFPNYSEGNMAYGTNGSGFCEGYCNSFIRDYIEKTFRQNLEDGIKKYLKEVPINMGYKALLQQRSNAYYIATGRISAPLCALTMEMMLGFPSPWIGEDNRVCNNGQFALFQYDRRKMHPNKMLPGSYWLGDLGGSGEAWTYNYSYAFGTAPIRDKYAVRPFIVIG